MLGGIAAPDLAAARVQDSEEETRQRERIWYVACTRARDLLSELAVWPSAEDGLVAGRADAAPPWREQPSPRLLRRSSLQQGYGANITRPRPAAGAYAIIAHLSPPNQVRQFLGRDYAS